MRLVACALLLAAAACQRGIDLEDAGLAFPCDHLALPDAGPQCSNGWKCGLEDVCHQRGVAGPYACNDASDCESGWLCSVDKHCADAAQDGLLGTPGSQTLTAKPLPGVALSGPYTGAGFEPFADACAPDTAVTLAWVDGGTLFRERFFPGGRSGADAGACPATRVHHALDSVAYGGAAPSGLLALGGAVYTLDAQGLLCVAREASGALLALSCTSVAAGASGLTGRGPWLATHTGHQVWVIDAAATPPAATAFDVTQADGGAVTVNDVAIEEDAPGSSLLYAGTDDGLYWGPVTGGVPALTRASCVDATLTRVKLVHPGGDLAAAPALVALGTGHDAAQTPRALVMFPDLVSSQSCALDAPGGGRYFPALGESCTAPLASLPLDVTTGRESASAWWLELRQQALVEQSVSGSLACQPASPALSPAYQAVTALPLSGNAEALADAAGHAWVNRRSLVPDRVPTVAMGGATNLVLAAPPLDEGDPAAWAGTTSSGLWLSSLAWLGGRPLTGVTGDPSLWVTEEGVQRRASPDQPSLGASLSGAGALEGPFHAAASAHDGGELVVLSSFDSLLAGQLAAPGADAGTLSRRLAPVPGAPIDSVAFYPEEQDYFAHGYVVATGLLVEVLARNPIGWTAQPVDLGPIAPPIRVWIDHGRARVGASDGTIEILPSRVPVADPLSETVLEYQLVCGNVFALTSQRLYWLKVNAPGETGAWQPLDVPGLAGPLVGLYATEQSLLVSAADGRTYVVGNVSCK